MKLEEELAEYEKNYQKKFRKHMENLKLGGEKEGGEGEGGAVA
jgi:hypothetical protein